jgi:hypothetical protein
MQLEPFDELIAQLRARQLNAAADSLSRLRTSTWSSSAEMIGELGLTVLRLQSDKNLFPVELTPLADRCMNEVRKVWPEMGKSAERSELDELREALAGSVRRRLILWAVRWLLGFAAIAVVVHFYPALSWLFWAGAAVAALSLVVTLSIHAFANRRLNLGKRRLDEYERIAREAEEHAVIRGKSK